MTVVEFLEDYLARLMAERRTSDDTSLIAILGRETNEIGIALRHLKQCRDISITEWKSVPASANAVVIETAGSVLSPASDVTVPSDALGKSRKDRRGRKDHGSGHPY